MNLIEAIKNDKEFQKKPPNEQEALLLLANRFMEDDKAIYMTPDELANKLGTGSSKSWRKLLNLKAMHGYIQEELEKDFEINHRSVLLKQYQKAAYQGDTQAANTFLKQYEALQDNASQMKIILHYIPRPEEEKENGEV